MEACLFKCWAGPGQEANLAQDGVHRPVRLLDSVPTWNACLRQETLAHLEAALLKKVLRNDLQQVSDSSYTIRQPGM